MGTKTHVYTDFIDAKLNGGVDARISGEIAIRALRSTLRRALQKRGLWSGAPAWVGLSDHLHWDSDALNSFTAEAFLYLFSPIKLAIIQKLRRAGPIDGYVVTGAQMWVRERHKNGADAVGYTVFRTVRQALALASAKAYILIEGPKKFDSQSIIRWPKVELNHPLQPTISLPSDDDWFALIRLLNVANARTLRICSLAERLPDFYEQGTRRTRCLTIINAIKNEVYRLINADRHTYLAATQQQPTMARLEDQLNLIALDALLKPKLYAKYTTDRANRLVKIWNAHCVQIASGSAPLTRAALAQQLNVSRARTTEDHHALAETLLDLDPNILEHDPLALFVRLEPSHE